MLKMIIHWPIRSLLFIIAVSFCNNEKGSAMFSNETDRQALLAFKCLIIEDPLGSLSSWNNSLPLCEWRGITCGHKHQRVVVLDLRSQKLTGHISSSIGNLTFLRSIHLQDNGFQGNIPQEITLLTRLQLLNLRNNALQGEIPANLSNCPNLTILELSSNDLVGKIPVLLGSLSKLTFLISLSNNLVGGLPPSLGNLTLLQGLYFGDNSLDGNIPDSIGRLTNLEYFEIGLNNLSGAVPPSLYNISSIINFFIAFNPLTGGLPPDIGLTLPNLRAISTAGNPFSGPFPASFSNASEMRHLDLSSNGLSGPIPIDLGRRMNDLRLINLEFNNLGTGDDGDISFLDSLTNCTKLQSFSLAENGFGGVLPNSIGNLSIQLNRLFAGGNQFVGTIPVGISNLVNLVGLTLEFNSLSGTIPFDMGKLSNLLILSLWGNKLDGLIPYSIGNLTQLFELYLQHNNLTGSIPSSVENIKAIQILNMSYNRFVGPIPNTVGLFSTLRSMNLAHNSFTGPLPLEIGSLSNLEELDVSENKLSGRIPSTLGNCLKLESLQLEGNLFQGGIPQFFSSLKGIVDLDLSRNNLSGKIPVDLETLMFINNLNLSFNNLEGEVPSKGIFTNLSIVSLDGNKKLCGGVKELQLPACPIQEFKKKENHLVLKIVVPISSAVVSLAFASLLVVLCKKRKLRNNSSTNAYDADVFLRVSYDQLLKATEGFASTNLIGAGSFGTVYKGILHQTEKPVAVKVLNLEQLGASKSFISECAVLRNTRHRNLLKMITACSSVNSEGNDFKALVFEFMSNGSLESWLYPREDELSQARNQSLIQRLNIAIDVASALDYLHHHCETPIVHCDLKPSNVLLDEDMTAHVGDFGLARLLKMNDSGVGGQTNSIAIKGSIGYIAPEYGMGGEVSTKGDVYSYGILLLEMITGKRPADNSFTDGLSLHLFSKMALSEQVMEIVDSRLLLENSNEATNNAKNQIVLKAKMCECLISLVKIGVACSAESPTERMEISNVVMELKIIKEVLLGVGIHAERRMRSQLAGEGTSHAAC